MTLTLFDWGIVAAYFILSIGVGVAFTKRGGESLEQYFVAGRAVPWWLAGAAMIATTFAADTPLGRIATAHEVADAVLFFASPLAHAITGQSLDVNAGNWFD